MISPLALHFQVAYLVMFVDRGVKLLHLVRSFSLANLASIYPGFRWRTSSCGFGFDRPKAPAVFLACSKRRAPWRRDWILSRRLITRQPEGLSGTSTSCVPTPAEPRSKGFFLCLVGERKWFNSHWRLKHAVLDYMGRL